MSNAKAMNDIKCGLNRIGATAELNRLIAANNAGDATASVRLEELKRLAKKRYRELAFELHPDRTGGDEGKTAQFREVTAAHDWLQRVRLTPAPARRPPTQTQTMRSTVFVVVTSDSSGPYRHDDVADAYRSFFSQMWPGGWPGSSHGGRDK